MLGMRVLSLVFLTAVLVVPFTLYFLTLQKALSRCSPECRTLRPGLVWLLAIPLFNGIWYFVVVNALSKSLHNEFEKRNIAEHPAPGRNLGFALCILCIMSMAPYLRLVSVAALVCWIVYWVKIAGYSAKLQLPVA